MPRHSGQLCSQYIRPQKVVLYSFLNADTLLSNLVMGCLNSPWKQYSCFLKLVPLAHGNCSCLPRVAYNSHDEQRSFGERQRHRERKITVHLLENNPSRQLLQQGLWKSRRYSQAISTAHVRDTLRNRLLTWGSSRLSPSRRTIRSWKKQRKEVWAMPDNLPFNLKGQT